MKLAKVWLVSEPTPDSTLEDIVFETTPARIALQVKGGYEPGPTDEMFTEKHEAEAEGRLRLFVRDVAKKIRETGISKLTTVCSMSFHNGAGDEVTKIKLDRVRS